MRNLTLSALTLLLMPVAQADAATLFLKGSDKPLHVKTLRETPESIVVGVPEADGTFTERLIEKRNIDQLIRTVSAERLTALDPAKPAMYRDYAEELTAKKVDPDARQAAIRLYLIAAHLDGDNLGRSSLLGMASLARSPAEERRFRAMIFLLDPKHDHRVLKETVSTAGETTDEAEAREGLIAALRLLRQGNRRIARRMVERTSVAAAFARYGGAISRDEFLAACDSAESLDEATLMRVIHFELELSGGKIPRTRRDGTAGPGWAAALETGNTSPAPGLTLKTLTEFDPAQCLYRDGKWVAPGE